MPWHYLHVMRGCMQVPVGATSRRLSICKCGPLSIPTFDLFTPIQVCPSLLVGLFDTFFSVM